MARRFLVVYHDKCPDGTAARACFYKAFPEAQIASVPFNYGPRAQPIITEAIHKAFAEGAISDVWVVDVTLSVWLLDMLQRSFAGTINWVDHHRSTSRVVLTEAQKARLALTFDEGACGAMLTWRLLFATPPARPPAIISVVDAYDRHCGLSDPLIRKLVDWFIVLRPLNVQVVLDAWPRKLTQPDWQAEMELLEVASQMRKATLEPVLHSVKTYLGHLKFGNRSILAVQVLANDHMGDLLFEKLRSYREFAAKSDIPAPEIAFWRSGGYHCSVVMRTPPESTLDLSELAEQFGGGGHAHAAAFILPAKEFASIWTLTKRVSQRNPDASDDALDEV